MNNYDLSLFDYVYCPSEPIDISKYPQTTKFLFGPHFSVFPDHKVANIQSKNSLYIMPGQWCVDDWKSRPICQNLNMTAIPFGVDTDKFCEIKPIQERTEVFIYYKTRHPNELSYMTQLLNYNNITFKLFNYQERYNEEDYIKCLQSTKYGIWIGRHESQGFALEEALSCNIPLFIWNVRSMNQELGCNYPDIPASVIPYWDERCGEFFYEQIEIGEKITKFMQNLYNYKPREYVVENLSMKVCEQKFINTITKIL
jgi:hypothetical protein